MLPDYMEILIDLLNLNSSITYGNRTRWKDGSRIYKFEQLRNDKNLT